MHNKTPIMLMQCNSSAQLVKDRNFPAGFDSVSLGHYLSQTHSYTKSERLTLTGKIHLSKERATLGTFNIHLYSVLFPDLYCRLNLSRPFRQS